MRILITADLHFREHWFQLLSRAAEWDLLCIAGDLLDMFNAEPRIMQAKTASRWIRELAKVTRVAICSGNHDHAGRQITADRAPRVRVASRESASLLNTIITHHGGQAVPLPGTKICRERITQNVDGADLSYFHLQDLEAKGLLFSKCKFQHCVFERCYFRNVTFEDCDFTGARFIDSNLRGAILITCKLEYTYYRVTVLDRAQFAANLPLWENVRAEVARSLRTNAHGLGDSEGVKYFINVEMDGTLEHWRKAFRQKESYYKEKYAGFRRVQAFGRYIFYRLDRFAWGHGERPFRILRNVLLLICGSAVFLTIKEGPSISNLSIGQLIVSVRATPPFPASLTVEGRTEKDRAIRQKQEIRFWADIEKLRKRIAAAQLRKPAKIYEAIGRLKERYPRVARHYELAYDEQ